MARRRIIHARYFTWTGVVLLVVGGVTTINGLQVTWYMAAIGIPLAIIGLSALSTER